MKSYVELITEVKKSIDQEDNKALVNIEDSMESTTVATSNHALGSYLIYDKKVYEVTTAISVGDTLVIYPATGYNIKVADDIMTMIETLRTENQTLTNNLDDEVETRAKLGAHNLALPLNDITNSSYGLTITTDSNGVSTVSGTSTGNGGRLNHVSNIFTLKAGSYKLYSNRSDENTYCDIAVSNISDSKRIASTDTNNVVEFTINADTNVVIGLNTRTGTVYSNDFKIKPMITLISDASNEFTPYAMTNRELTDVAQQEIGNYMYKGTYNTSVAADGVKDYETLINDVSLAFLAKLQALADDEIAFVKQLTINSVTSPIITKLFVGFNNTATSFDIDYSKTTIVVGTGVDIIWGRFNTTKSGVRCASVSLNAGVAIPTPTDLRSAIATSGATFTIYYQVYKKIQ